MIEFPWWFGVLCWMPYLLGVVVIILYMGVLISIIALSVGALCYLPFAHKCKSPYENHYDYTELCDGEG